MPCFSQIINTKMIIKDRIVEAISDLEWTVEERNENYLIIKTKERQIVLSRSNFSQSFSTRDTEVESHLAVLQKQYNVKVTTNWANKMGYKAKEVKQKMEI